MFRKNEYDSATFHFQQLLERKPGASLVFVFIVTFLRCFIMQPHINQNLACEQGPLFGVSRECLGDEKK